MKIVIVSLFLATGMSLKAHPIKMTTGKLEINTKEKTCHLTLNFFIDDFTTALKEIYPLPDFDFQQPDDIVTGTILQYINHHFDLNIDSISIAFRIKTVAKIDSNVAQAQLEGNIQAIDHFVVAEIKDVLLFSIFSKQSNILHVIIDDKDPEILQYYKSVPVREIKFP